MIIYHGPETRGVAVHTNFSFVFEGSLVSPCVLLGRLLALR
jgi:hypothetical protein